MNSGNFFAELKRRNVYKVAVAYIVAGWALAQGSAQVLPVFEVPNWVVRLTIVLLVLGFPVALSLAWLYELTPEGIKRTEDVDPSESIRHHTGRKIVVLTIVLAALALAVSIIRLPHARNESAPAASSIVTNEAIPLKSIAVLPFENHSQDPSNAYFADGIQDEILIRLAKIADLKVISRSSTQRYKSAGENLSEVGRELRVAHVLEGSVQKSGDTVRIIVRLIKAADNSHLWAGTFDRKLTDIFSVETEVAKAIADQLQARLTGREAQVIAATPTRDTDAYDAYLRAKELLYGALLNEPAAMQQQTRAIELLEDAVRRDPNFAVAYCLLVEANLNLHWVFETPRTREKARSALAAARRIAPDAAETHLAEALFSYYGQRDYDRALESLEKAAPLLPNNPDVFSITALVERRLGRWTEAGRHLLKAIELDPRSWRLRGTLIGNYTLNRNYPEAERAADRAIADVPDRADYFRRLKIEAALCAGNLKSGRETLRQLSVPTSFWKTWQLPIFEHHYVEAERVANSWTQRSPYDELAYPRAFIVGLTARASGQTEKAQSAFLAARDHFVNALRERDQAPLLLSHLALVDAALGRKDEALEEARRAVQLRPTSSDALDGPELERHLALVCLWTGERDLALEKLAELAKLLGSGVTYGELKFDPAWQELRGDPRFEKIVQSLAPR